MKPIHYAIGLILLITSGCVRDNLAGVTERFDPPEIVLKNSMQQIPRPQGPLAKGRGQLRSGIQRERV